MTLHNENVKVGVIYRSYNDEKYAQKLISDVATKKNDTLFLHFSALTANLLYMSGAADYVWTSPVIPKLQTNDTNVNPLGTPITTYDIALIAGLPKLFLLIGALSFGKLPDFIGRQRTLVCMALGMVVSNLLVAFGGHIYIYYICRSLFSLCFGGVSVALPVYLSEISEDHNRVKFVCIMNVCFPLGNLLAFIIGPITSVRMFTLLCIMPILPALFLFAIAIPESPVYLASNSNKITTMKALIKLRSNKSNEEIEKDYFDLQRTLEARRMEPKSTTSIWPFESKALKKGFIIATVINMAQHSSGVAALMSFLGPLFTEAGAELTGNTIAILVGIVKMSAFFLTSMIVEKVGRRPLLLISSASTGVPLFILGLYFHWKNNDAVFIDSIRWLPVFVVLIYVICYSIGLGPIPSAVTTELFPSDIKSIAVSYQSTLIHFFSFGITTAFPIVAKFFGAQYCIWFFSLNCFLGFLGIYYMLPETKGKSALDIQHVLSK